MPSQYIDSPVSVQAGKPTNYVYRQRDWENTLNYWAVHGNKISLPINTYRDSRVSLSQALGHEVVENKVTGNLVSDTRIGYATVGDLNNRHAGLSSWVSEFEPSDGQMLNEAAIKALGKLSDSKVNLPVTVAEAHKTVDLILGKASQIYQFGRNLRRGRLKDALHSLGLERAIGKKKSLAAFSANQWLEYKYGWMPLLMDVKGAAEAVVDRLHGGRIPWATATAVVSATAHRYTRELAEGYSPGSYYEESASAVKTYKVKIEAEISNPHLNTAQQLGLTNPALVAWELVPFSFVFDWFVQVGDFLTAATALQGVNVRRAFSSRVREVSTSYYSHAHPYIAAQNRSTGYDFKFNSWGRSYDRAPFAVNSLLLYPPLKRDPLNFNRLATGLALLRGNARSFRV